MAKRKQGFIEDKPEGVVYSKQNISLNDMHSYRILFRILITLWRGKDWKGDFSPVSIDILNNLPLLSFVPAFLQLWTLCRFSELKQIKIKDIKAGGSFVIHSTKSDNVKTAFPLPFISPQELKSIKDKTKIVVVSYDSYKDSIIRVKDSIGFSPVENIKDCTHIFRHLEASFLSHRGASISDISYKLGHSNEKTSLEYIHQEWRF